MKKIFTTIFLFAFAIASQAQQAAQYSLYMWNKHAFNPAYAGMENSLSITGVYRSQWANLPGNPVSQAVNAHAPFYFAGGGVGISLENQTLGSWKQTTTALSYDYQMVVNNSGVLSLGLSAGFIQRQFDGTLARTPQGLFDDEGNYLGHSETTLPFTIETGSAPTFSFGAFYQGEKLEVGISATNLAENEISLSTISFVPERTYYLYTGYSLDLSRKIQLRPSLLVKSDVYQTQVDISLVARYNENIFAGATFRGYDSNSQDALALIGGVKLNEKISFGYAYDLTLSGLSNVNNGTHEILLNYNLGKQIGQGNPQSLFTTLGHYNLYVLHTEKGIFKKKTTTWMKKGRSERNKYKSKVSFYIIPKEQFHITFAKLETAVKMRRIKYLTNLDKSFS